MQPSWSVGDSSAGHVESLYSPELHFPLLATDDDDLQLSPPFCRHRGRPSASDITSGERTGTDVTEPAGSSSRCRRSGCQTAAGRRTRGARFAVVRAVAERRRTIWPTEEDRGANSSAASGGAVVTQRRRAGVGGRHCSPTAICRHLLKRPGRGSSRHRRKSKPPLVPLGVAAAGRRRGRDPTASTMTAT